MVEFPNPRKRHPFHMHDMIRAQPAYAQETLDRLRELDARAFLGRARNLVVTGCGTSFHAALIGARLLQEGLGDTAIVRAVHAYDVLHGFTFPRDCTVLGVSHSGSTSTTNDALALARRSGAATRGLCGLPESRMNDIADEVLALGSVHDHSWANTMSYTTQLTAFARLAEAVASRPEELFPSGLGTVPAMLRGALACEPRVRRLSARVGKSGRVTFLGSGLDEVTALEAALKIRETCSFPASGYHIEQFQHGPFLSLDRRESVIAIRSNDDADREAEILRGIARTGASVSTMGEAPDVDVPIPAVARLLRPIVSIVPLQFVAYYVALARKTNPDIMRSDVPRYRPGLAPLFG
ncbi:MAG TPA: SIS domain-containing protein [Thermoplasmata archaeon]|nr:SIS domain-containing protein [Thermoplasmata archaeon]